MLVGHALRKHGLAVRISLAILSLPGVARSGGSLICMLLIASAVISALVNDPVRHRDDDADRAVADAVRGRRARRRRTGTGRHRGAAHGRGGESGGSVRCVRRRAGNPGGQRVQPADPRGAGADDQLQRQLCAVDVDRRRSRGGPRSHLLPGPEVAVAAGSAHPFRSPFPGAPATGATGPTEPRRRRTSCRR